MKKKLIFIVILLFVLAACDSGISVDPEELVTQGAGVVSDALETVEGEGEDEPTAEPVDEPVDEPMDESTPEPTSDAPRDRWAGTAYDTSLAALSDVHVTINGVEAQSDASGNFELSVPQADNARYVINAEKEGYLPISLIHIGSAMESLVLEFQPVEQFTVDPTQPIDNTDSRGTNISIEPNQLVDENGNPATEDLTLSTYTYDLTNEEMVGDMSGTNTDGDSVSMESAGAFYAEFTDDEGNEYNLADDASADVSMPCENQPAEQLTVWSYDTNTGLWIEEGPATIENGNCNASVTHFSYWNFDYEKRDPACIKLDIEAGFLAENTPLSVRAVLQTNPTRVRDMSITQEANVLINLPANTDVQFFMASDSVPFKTTNSGAPWGGTGVPAFPYDVCNGLAEVAPAPTVGTLQGQVTDAVNGNPIAGAQVCIQATNQCATADDNGMYTISDAPLGDQVLNVTAEGFIAVNDQGVTITAGDPTMQPVALSPELAEGELRIVLTWGENPGDLDSTLWLPDSTKINYDVKGQTINGTLLDLDDQNGEGPETITISEQQDGTYTYAVHNFSGNGTASLSASNAVVRVYRGNQEIASFLVPTTGDGLWWTVFTLDASGNLTEINTLSDTQPIQ